ncbi:U7 snRNA-associated Sm-like protein LSm10 [Limulus polyphemus]|uniref:U7 snRNA-associated Sm-like protein LSm10 n=1 Tax=Limulus polyphemus TaxID=6850 RepID=A0ABM1C5T4_LIMPO|nr:U7 snRNA-associated Sm-like protein LSm10 [Limulus polyphemus]
MASLRERALSTKTLVCLLQALQERETTVELRNEVSILGRIEIVDGYMNLTMTDVTLTTPNNEQQKYESFFVQGKQVRFVHIPDDINIVEAIKKQLNLIRGRGQYKERKQHKKALAQTLKIRQENLLMKERQQESS